MIVDKDTNQVFVSEWLQKVHPAFFSRFSELLKNVHIKWLCYQTQPISGVVTTCRFN